MQEVDSFHWVVISTFTEVYDMYFTPVTKPWLRA